MLAPRAVVIRRIGAYRAANHPVLSECHARRYGLFRERAVAIITVEFVRLRIVRHEQIGPSIVVVIEHRDAEGLTGGIGYRGLASDIFKAPAAQIMIQL